MSQVFYLSALLFLCACHPDPEKRSINVTGRASLKVVPDMVELSLRARNIKPAMKDAVAQTQS
ncbi:MAG TPA: SIMPL domain-containing protein, partial [Flavisolibacter sp.]|nr:SIMPL domain-containing protein [Flavisolibacter sp.]